MAYEEEIFQILKLGLDPTILGRKYRHENQAVCPSLNVIQMQRKKF